MLLVAFFVLLIWQGWLGSQPHDWLARIVESWTSFYQTNEKSIELVLKAAGIIATLVSGALTFATGLYFANRSLPKRLVNYLEECKVALLGDRDLLLEGVAQKYAINKKLDGSWFKRKQSQRQLAIYLREMEDTAVKSGGTRQGTVTRLAERLKVLSEDKASNEIQKATAHLVRGCEFAFLADAADSATNGGSVGPSSELRTKAINEFRDAAFLDRRELRALDFICQQFIKLGQVDEALACARDWSQAAENDQREFDKARATRVIATCYELKSRDPSLPQNRRREYLTQARRCLELSRDIFVLPRISLQKIGARLELGLTYEQLSNVLKALAVPALAATNRRLALGVFRELNYQDGINRLQD